MTHAQVLSRSNLAGTPVIRRFALAALGWTGLAGMLALWLGTVQTAVAAVLLCGAALALATRGCTAHYPHDRVGLCNLVTQARMALIAVMVIPVLSAPVAAPLAWGLTGLAALALALDGVDGWLARRAGLTSGFGARFDMEVDALFGAVLALAAIALGKAGIWVLALGAMRYAFLAAAWAWPWLGGALPFSQRRRAVCVVQIATLVALIAPVVVPPVSAMLAAVATGVLAWSFAVDVTWLRRHR